MGIRKPNLSVKEARHLASVRSAAVNGTAKPDEKVSGSGPTNASAAKAGPSRVDVEPYRQETAVERGAISTLRQHRPGRVSPTASAGSRLDGNEPPGPVNENAGANDVLPPAFLRPADKVQVFLSAPIPAEGVSSIYPILAGQYGPQKALQMILRKALNHYEKLLRNGSFQDKAQTYPTISDGSMEVIVQTSRMMPRAAVLVARAHFDPLGFESTRAFGRKLGTAALAAFFANERTTG